MRERLLKEGFIRVFAQPERVELLEMAYKLKTEGHSVTMGVTEIGTKIVSAEAHHYMTCNRCKSVMITVGDKP